MSREAMAKYAPCWYSPEQADAWASGYNSALEEMKNPGAVAEPSTEPTAHGGWRDRPNRELDSPDRGQPFFLTQWEREDYERRLRGQPELGPGAPVEDRTAIADELKQAHDDLDALYVPREQGGLKLSIAGRILLLAARKDAARLAERAALNSIAEWRKVNISGEYEHGLRDIIRSIVDCAVAALESATYSLTSNQKRE